MIANSSCAIRTSEDERGAADGGGSGCTSGGSDDL